MLTISGLTYRVAGRTLIEDATAQIAAGWKVGLVGRNGAGKSSLLDLVRGARQADDGTLSMPKNWRIGFLAQEAPGGEATPLETVLAADTERARLLAAADSDDVGEGAVDIHERLHAIDAHRAPARAASILAGLGFDHAEQTRPMASFSGGWRMRVALAGVLFAEPELLLLDEPTNHLDLEAALWLAEYLRRYRKTYLLVSHDRQFLDEAVDHILDLSQRRLTLYSGGYAQFQRARSMALSQQKTLAARQDMERKRLQAFIDRFRAKATKASQAQSRVKALARLEPVAVPEDEAPVRLEFPEPANLAPPLLTIDRASVGYEPGKPVLHHLDLRLDPDDRIALLGANGNGKSTFARLLAGRLPPMSGEMRRAPKLACGYFAQHQIEELDAAATAYDHLARLLPDARPEALRARLARFGFGVDKVFVPVGKLSGGEKARLTFAIISVNTPSLLILDEPTNHLDLETSEALVTAINEFPGAVVLISHDWHLLSLTADRLWLVADGTVRPYDGDLDDYRRLVLSPPEKDWSDGAAAPGARRQARRDTAGRRQDSGPLRRRLRDAEKKLADLTARKAAVERTLANPTTYATAGETLQTLLRDQARIGAALDEAEARWLEAAQAIEEDKRA